MVTIKEPIRETLIYLGQKNKKNRGKKLKNRIPENIKIKMKRLKALKGLKMEFVEKRNKDYPEWLKIRESRKKTIKGQKKTFKC